MSVNPETVEVVSGDARLSNLANAIAVQIEYAVEDCGLGVDDAVCVVVQVAADYARSQYGSAYLPQLARLIIGRGEMPMPNEEQSA